MDSTFASENVLASAMCFEVFPKSNPITRKEYDSQTQCLVGYEDLYMTGAGSYSGQPYALDDQCPDQ